MNAPCLLTEERLEKLLQGKLQKEERALLREHLQAPCEECIPLIAELDERLLIALSGEASKLSEKEADRMFARALPSKGLLDRIRERFGGGFNFSPALAMAAVVLLIAIATPIYFTTPQVPYDGIKGQETSHVEVQLIGLVGTHQDGRPVVIRRAKSGEHLQDGEVMLLRYRLKEAAYVQIFVEGETRIPLLKETRMPAGEHELTQRGMAISIDPAQMGGRALFTILASKTPCKTECQSTAQLEVKMADAK